MATTKEQIGFSQRIKLDWIEYTANLQIAGHSKEEITQALQELLLNQLSIGRSSPRCAREKTISILTKIWVTVPKPLQALKDAGLYLLKILPNEHHIALHWCMAMAVYPFWGIVAEITGRLLNLQESVSVSQVQRRLREHLGERETVSRSGTRVLRSFINWGVLEESGQKGIYVVGKKKDIVNDKLATWMLEASLLGSGKLSSPLQSLIQNPNLFPFQIRLTDFFIRENYGNLKISRNVLGEDIVSL